MSGEYRNNHYVPVWYQRRFLRPTADRNELFYLDLKPGTFTNGRGQVLPRRAVRRTGLRKCFAETDLYTTHFGGVESRDLERLFFGEIDNRGRRAVDYFARFEHPSADGEAFNALLNYMSVQKFRTPKGLGWLNQRTKTAHREETLQLVVRLQNFHSAIWTECIWQLADAADTATKFILSDHPVTVYNRSCGPASTWCRGFSDPDIAFHATHTIFPLSLSKILILTNLSWCRNPYQKERAVRPNPNPWRSAMFNFTEIQTRRRLTELEVQQINFIIKSRALRFVAAAEECWLYPELTVSKQDWADFGDGYLLMPDPRGLALGGTMIIGYSKGGAEHFDEYGRRPWEPGFESKAQQETERKTFYRFQGEFAARYGPYRRGRAWEFDHERDSDDMHAFHLRYVKGRKYRSGKPS